jgi:hypothetical protein
MLADKTAAKRSATALAGLAIALCAVPLIGPYIGLGLREDFIFYRLFGLSRSRSLLLGLVLFLPAAIIWGWPFQRLRSACAGSWGSSARVVQLFERLSRYFQLGAASPAPAYPRRDQAALLIFAGVLQAVYLLAIPIGIECDATMYYDYARAMLGLGGWAPYWRPPLYPIFLMSSGVLWPGTFLGLVLAQAAIGIAAPIVLYRCLFGLGRIPALVGAFAFIASTIPFTGTKVMLAEPLFMLLGLLCVLSLARYHDGGDPRSIYAMVLFGLGAMFTRWEGEFVLGACLIASIVLSFRHRHHLRHAIAAVTIVAIVLAGYSVVRGLVRDRSLIGTFQTAGFQLLNRFYKANYVAPLGRGQPTATEPRDKTLQPVQFIHPSNGPATVRLRNLVADHARKHPESFHRLKPVLDGLVRKAPKGLYPDNLYEEAFGRFESTPEAFADHVFSTVANNVTLLYVDFTISVAQEELSLRDANRLLESVIFEAIRQHPILILQVVRDAVLFTGLDLDGIYNVVTSPLRTNAWAGVLTRFGRFANWHVPFDLAGCASASLSERLFAEYRFERRLQVPIVSAYAADFGSFGRNFVRPIVGGLVLLGWWLLFFSKRRIFDLAVAAAAATLTGGTAFAVGGNGVSRYENLIFPLMLIVAVAIAAQLATMLGLVRKEAAHR